MTDGRLKLETRLNPSGIDLVPVFWKVLRETAKDPEKLALQAAGAEFMEIFRDMRTRYAALNILTCPVYKPYGSRTITMRRLPDQILTAWSGLGESRKSFFRDRLFLVPEDAGRFSLYDITNSVTSLSSLPDRSGQVLENDRDYLTDEGRIVFNEDPFELEWVYGIAVEKTITVPWGGRYSYNEAVMYASGLDTLDSPLFTHYEGLVSDTAGRSMFSTEALYALFVYNYFKTLYKGGTVPSLQGFINAMAGSPYILENAETVVRFDVVLVDGVLVRRVYTDRHSYDIPLGVPLGSWVIPGAVLEKYTPIGEYIKINNYAYDPEWVGSQTHPDLAYLTDKSSGISEPVEFDLDTTYSFSEIAAAPVMQRPRFDTSWSPVDENGRIRTGTYGLWHKVVGPDFVMFEFATQELYDSLADLFIIILKEILPIHIIYGVDINEALLDYLSGVLLDHDEDPLLGTV